MAVGDMESKTEMGLSNKSLLWLGVLLVLTLAVCVHLLATGASLPEQRPTVASIISKILLSEKVPPDNRIISLVHQKTGNKKFNKRDLAWYKTKVRQGKLKGQLGPHAIDQKIARYHNVGRFGGRGMHI